MIRISNIVEHNKAQLGLRFLNNLLDYVILLAINFALVALSRILFELTSFQYFYLYVDGGPFWDILSGTINCFLYYFLMEKFLDGRTVGKYITGTKAISVDGTRPTTEQYVYRNLARLVPFDALSFFGVNGWHDSWSNTRVINVKNYNTEIQAKSEIERLGEKEIV